jgi:exonuclease SbcC
MKILAVRIKNLASLEGITEIDFTHEPLCSAGIFAITGPTGAGKSTILDALCLALYAQTPRYNKSNDPNQSIQDISGNSITQSDPRKILRDGAADGYAEVDFIGTDGHRHRANWSVRRSRNKADGALQPYQVTCKNLDTHADVQGTRTETIGSITQKIGLTFDQFTRAVLLAQGDFTAFLKAPNNEKSDLLEKLTGTQIYSEISKRIFERHRQEKEELDRLLIQKESISILPDEELETLNKRRTELITILQEQQKQEAILTKELAWHQQLNVLLEKVTQSTTVHDTAVATKQAVQEREEKFRMAEQLQPTRPLVEGLTRNRKLLAEKETLQTNLTSSLLTLNEQRLVQEEALKTAQQNLDTANKQQADTQPLLNKAKELDVHLKERTDQQEAAAKEFSKTKEALHNHNQQLSLQQEKALQLDKTIDELTAYREKHESRQLLAENHKLIIAGLTEAKKYLEEEHQAIQNINLTGKTLETKQEAAEIQKKALALTTSTVDTLSETVAQLQHVISVADINTMQQHKSEADARAMETMQAIADWKTLLDATIIYDKNRTTIKNNKAELEANQQKLQKATRESETSKTLKEAVARSLDIARLAAAKDVVSLRQQLSKGDACPVCGSTEHPYADHDPRFNEVLTGLEAQFNQEESKHTEALKIQSALQEKQQQLNNNISNLSDEQLLKERDIKEYRESWNRFAQHAEADKLPQEEVAGWLKKSLTKQQSRQKEVQAQLDQLQKQQQELDTYKNKLEQAKEQHTTTTNQLKDLERELTSLRERLDQLKQQQDKAAKNLEASRVDLTVYFSNADWFENWKANTGTFTQSISDFANEWNLNTEKLSITQSEKGILTATVAGLKNQQESLQTDVTKKEQSVSTLKQQYDALLAERTKLFKGKATAEVELLLKTSIDKAQHELEQSRAALENSNTRVTRVIAQQDEAQKELVRLQGEIKQLDDKLNEWLSAYNARNSSLLDVKELETMLAFSLEWIETERLAIQKINTAIEKTQAILTEHKTALDKHREQPLSDRTIEAVTEQISTVKQALAESIREDAATELRLKQDTMNRQQAGVMIEQVASKEKVVDNWAKLNQVIGSADGKKFRQVAQEYTLDVLLEYTNVQLDMLSKRYVLQRINESLGMQVVDRDMGKEVRSVNSLSGGESFLVSLSLALGLASLSSSRMQVESLFIDEGFGSLDPNTLNVAMDVLERLHNQGRKVGVISHVQEMTERIPVQIKVSKLNGGKSAVEVMGV